MPILLARCHSFLVGKELDANPGSKMPFLPISAGDESILTSDLELGASHAVVLSRRLEANYTKVLPRMFRVVVFEMGNHPGVGVGRLAQQAVVQVSPAALGAHAVFAVL